MAQRDSKEKINDLCHQLLESLNSDEGYDRDIALRLCTLLFGSPDDDSRGYIEVFVLWLNSRRNHFFTTGALEDIVQETAVTFIKKLNAREIHKHGNIASFVAGIALNKYREAAAREKRAQTLMSGFEVHDAVYFDPAFKEVIISEEANQILSRLDKSTNDILILTYLKGAPTDEIVEKLNLKTRNNYYVALHRAKDKAKKIYDEIKIQNWGTQ